MQGVLEQPPGNRRAAGERGWLDTGDIAVQDEDDYFFIVDRKKDMIIAGGYNIYPREIDEVLFQHPKVQEGVAVGIADKYRGETVKAFIVLKPGETCTAEEIIAFCREKLAAYKVPKPWWNFGLRFQNRQSEKFCGRSSGRKKAQRKGISLRAARTPKPCRQWRMPLTMHAW